MKQLKSFELEDVNGGIGLPLIVGGVILVLGVAGFINGCIDSQEEDCYYTDTEGNECPCGS